MLAFFLGLGLPILAAALTLTADGRFSHSIAELGGKPFSWLQNHFAFPYLSLAAKTNSR